MTTDIKKARARRMFRLGATVREIAEALDSPRSTVHMWISDPDGSKARTRKLRYRRPCPNCGTLMTGCNGHGPHAPKHCATCSNEIVGEHNHRRGVGFAETVCAMWAQGMTSRQIADVFGWKPRSMACFICGLRAKGYELAHRRTPEQRARMNGRQHMAYARSVKLERQAA